MDSPKLDKRREQILLYLYTQEKEVTAKNLMEKLGIPKQTVYQIVEELTDQGYLDITINPEDRIRRYRLKDIYRAWYAKGEELGIPLSFQLEEGPRRREEIQKIVVDYIKSCSLQDILVLFEWIENRLLKRWPEPRIQQHISDVRAALREKIAVPERR